MHNFALHLDRTMRSSEWLETHLCDEFGVEELAFEAGYSLHHFIRIFRKVTGRRPIEFVQQRRLTWASQFLLESKRPIQWISSQAGYDSPSSFGRAFKRQYGINPQAYRANKEHLWYRDVQSLDPDRLWHQLSGGVKLVEEHIELPDLTFWGLKSVQEYDHKSRVAPLGQFLDTCQIESPDLWEIRWSDSKQLLQGQYFQVYGISVQQDHQAPMDQLFQAGGSYACFRHHGDGDNDFFHSCNFIFQRWLGESDWIEDTSRPTLINHLTTDKSEWLDCCDIEVYIPTVPKFLTDPINIS